MKTLLVINASGRISRSLTRRLTQRFAAAWMARNPGAKIIDRDVGQNPPPPVNEAWIAAAFADQNDLSEPMRSALAVSERLIEEIAGADLVVLGCPMYNFGMPAQLKAYFDQIVRVGRTFAFAPCTQEPYRPLLPSKPVIVVSAAGDGALHPGGTAAHINFLEPHLQTLFGFIGLAELTVVRVGNEEHRDGHFRRSLEVAEAELDALAVGNLEAPTASPIQSDQTLEARPSACTA